jgi:hypothetical protein
MTAPQNPDRLIRTYLIEDQAPGQSEVPDHVYAAIRDGIEQTRQRAVLGSIGVPDMNNILRVGLAAAAIVIIAIVAINLLPGSPPPGGGPSPSPSDLPSEEPSTSADAGLPVGSSVELVGAVHVTIPATGWTQEEDSRTLLKDGNGAAPDGAYVIGAGWSGDPLIPSDPCGWQSTMPDTPATTLDEIVAALESQATRNASAAVDATVDGYPAKWITMEMPAGVTYSASDNPDCDEQKFCTLGFGDPDPAECYMWYQEAGQIDQLWIVDVDGLFHFAPGSYYAETPAAVVEEIGAILGSMTFGE